MEVFVPSWLSFASDMDHRWVVLPVTWDHPRCQLWDHPEGPPRPAERDIRLGLESRWRGGPMAFREVSVVQIKEVLRLWLRGCG